MFGGAFMTAHITISYLHALSIPFVCAHCSHSTQWFSCQRSPMPAKHQMGSTVQQTRDLGVAPLCVAIHLGVRDDFELFVYCKTHDEVPHRIPCAENMRTTPLVVAVSKCVPALFQCTVVISTTLPSLSLPCCSTIGLPSAPLLSRCHIRAVPSDALCNAGVIHYSVCILVCLTRSSKHPASTRHPCLLIPSCQCVAHGGIP